MPEKFPGQDEVELARLIREVTIGHVAFATEVAAAAEHWPTVLPIAICYDPGQDQRSFSLLLHGSTGSRWLRTLSQGGPASVAVTALDGLVVARSAFESSMHYRSAILFGRCSEVPEVDKGCTLDLITESLIPGRVAELRTPTRKELAATLVLRMAITDWSYKVSDGWPEDPDEDVAGPAWAGVLPRRTGFAAALPTADLRPGIDVPDSVARLLAD
jgi:nitroimidazol reductase NimA-like FMN-containing flavoprotein (pyridoxamine 5'-phosphate oxidase superfamily)